MCFLLHKLFPVFLPDSEIPIELILSESATSLFVSLSFFRSRCSTPSRVAKTSQTERLHSFTLQKVSIELGCKMATPFVVIVLFGCVWSVAGQAELMKLDDGYKAGALLAVDQVNTHPGVQQHFLFFRSIKKSEVDVSLDALFSQK